MAYPASKAAINLVTVQYAKAFPDMRINAVDPGFTKNGPQREHLGTQTVEQGREDHRADGTSGSDGPTGGFFNAEGSVPW